jgi:hypothetical protein
VTGGVTEGGLDDADGTWSYDPATDAWTERRRSPSVIGGQADAAWTGEEVVLWGIGTYPDDTDAVGARLRLGDTTWRPLAADPLPPVTWYEGTPGSNSSVWTGEEVLVFTGAVGPDLERPTVLGYDPATDRWRELGAAPEGGYHPTLLWTGEVVLALTQRVLALRP